MATTPTFVEVIKELRDMKSVFTTLSSAMTVAKPLMRSDAERVLANSMVEIGETMAKRLQSLSMDVSKLAVNHGNEDLEKIMEAISK